MPDLDQPAQVPAQEAIKAKLYAQIEQIFRYHAPNAEQQKRYERLRTMAREFARVMVEVTPVGPDQSAALRKIREAVMTANAAIALEGKL